MPFVPKVRKLSFRKLGQKRDVQAETKEALEEVGQALDAAADTRGSASKEKNFYDEMFDSEFWVALCFQSRAQKEAFLRGIGHDLVVEGDKYLDGIELAKRLKVPLPEAIKLIKSKPKYVEITAEKDEA